MTTSNARAESLAAVAIASIGAATGLELPFPPLPEPAPAVRVELGRLLFFDPILSGDRSLSCAHCHDPRHGLADGLPRKERAAVVLRYGYDLSYAAIGAALGSSEDAARQAASAGVRRLRRRMQ